MKHTKLLLLSFTFVCINLNSFAAFITIFPVKDTLPSPRKMMERRRELMQQSDSAQLTPDDYETLMGRKLLPFEKRRFEKARKRNAEYLKKHPRIKFKLWGFFLGLFLGPVGVAVAYIFSKSRDFKLSTLIGFAGWGVLIIPFIIVILLLTNGWIFR